LAFALLRILVRLVGVVHGCFSMVQRRPQLVPLPTQRPVCEAGCVS
jgi:hypothetical protein